MRQLIRGVHEFQRGVFKDNQRLFEQLADGQSPPTLFITCSDSRICPQLLTQSQPGELFILRVAGNIVPCFGAVQGGEAATIEYAVSVLKVQDIIVCGHSLCGAMNSLISGQNLDAVPAIKAYLQHAESTRRIVVENYADITEPNERLRVAIKENVLVQLENLRTHPSVAVAMARQEISLHGWVYEFETGKVYSYIPDRDQFLPVEEMTASMKSEVFESRKASM